MGILRAAMTQTINAYPDMPDRREDLPGLKDRLEDIRRSNVEHNIDLIRAASEAGARIICLGELFPMPYFAFYEEAMWLDCAEDAADGPTISALKETARSCGIVTVAPIYEKDASSGHRYDTAVVIDEKGAVLGKYRKAHIPCGTNEQGRFAETYYYGSSDAPPYFPVFKTSIGTIGVNICYDRHFEGVVAALAKAGAGLIFSPAVTFGDKSRRMWKHEFIVDAARHRVYIGGSNRKGAEKPWNQDFFGESYFAGPDGEALENVSQNPRLIISEMNLDALKKPDPSGWDLARDTRPDIYR